MENDWQICELEDQTKSFTEFTVSAVPEIWIFEENDGTMWCYWPKTNAVKKIKSKARPEPNRYWMTFKCRLLMNAEKFSTYKEALAAEKFCQNYSTLMDCSETENDGGVQQENVCDSTMDFDVSCYMDEDDPEENAMEVGHDSFAFNKAVAKAGPLYSKNETIKLNSGLPKIYCYDETSEESDGDDKNCLGQSNDTSHSKNVDDSSEKHVDSYFAGNFDYSQFKNVAGISTSTVLDIADAARKADDSPNDDIEAFVSKISKIEMNLFSFVGDMQNDFHELKEISQRIVKKPGLSCEAVRLESVNGNCENSLQNRQLLNDNSLQINDEQSKHDDVSHGIEKASNKVETVKACEAVRLESVNGNCENSLQNRQLLNDNSLQINDEQSKHDDVSHGIEKASNKVETVKACEAVRLESVNGNCENSLQNRQLLNDNSLQINDEQSKHYDVSHGIEKASNKVETVKACITREKIGTDVANSTPVQTTQNFNKTIETIENVIRLPVSKIEHYKKNEELLDEEDEEENLKPALIERLVPMNDEDEAGYVNRTVGLLFSDNFFINQVKWRPQKNCAYMKSSITMSCWKESHGKKFPEDIGSKRFIAHFRRIKSAKRAALKTKEKRKLASELKKN